jgi:hypothetical protein
MRRFLCACALAGLLAGCTYSVEKITPAGVVVSDTKASDQVRPGEPK